MYSLVGEKIYYVFLKSVTFYIPSRYKDFRLIDIPKLREVMPVTMEDFTEHVKESSKKGAEILRTQWVNECCDIIDEHRDNIEDLMPGDDPVNSLC